MPEVYDLDDAGGKPEDAIRAVTPPKSEKVGKPVNLDADGSVSRIQVGDDTQYKSKRKAPPPPNPRAQTIRAVILGVITVAAIAFIIYYAVAPKRPSGTATETPTTATNRPMPNMGSPGPIPNRGGVNSSYTPQLNNMGRQNPGGAPGFAPGADEQRPAQGEGIR